MHGVFVMHLYSIAPGDLLCKVRDFVHSAAKSADFAEQVPMMHFG